MIADTSFRILLICLILLCLFCSLIYKSRGTSRNERVFINVFLATAFSLLIAFRPETVPDTRSYMGIFSNIKTGVSYGFDIFGEAERVEYGFLYLIKFFKLFSENIRLFFFVISLLSVSIFMYGINRVVLTITGRKPCIPMILAVYISYFGIYYNGIAIRQGLAMALCILAFSYFLKRKYIRYFACFGLAFLIHRLSFILLFITLAYCIMRHLKISQVGYYIIAICFLIFVLSGMGYKLNRAMFDSLQKTIAFIGLETYLPYIENFAIQSNGFPLYPVFYTFIGFTLAYLIGNRRELKYLLNIYYVGVVLINLFVGIGTISRGVDYLLMFSLPVIGCLVLVGMPSKVNNNRKSATINNENTGYACGRTVKLSAFKKLLIGIYILGSFLVVINIIYPDLINLNI